MWIIWLIAGMFLGAIIGVLGMCLLICCGRADQMLEEIENELYQ